MSLYCLFITQLKQLVRNEILLKFYSEYPLNEGNIQYEYLKTYKFNIYQLYVHIFKPN